MVEKGICIFSFYHFVLYPFKKNKFQSLSKIYLVVLKYFQVGQF